MPQLIIEQPGVSTQTIPVGEDDIILGRSSDCNVILLAEEVSRHHAKISYKDGKYVIYDLKSLNGTYVNRQRITEKTLQHMDEIWLGSRCRIIFRDDLQYGKKKFDDGHHIKDSRVLNQVEEIRKEIEKVESTLFRKLDRGLYETRESAERITEKIDYEQLRRAYRRLNALYKVNQIMTSPRDFNSKLAEALELVIEVLSAERGFILLKNEKTNALVIKVARSMGESLEASSPSMGIAGKAAIDGEPVLMVDRSQNAEFGWRESVIMHKISSAMCVPMKIEERILGSIYVDSIRRRVDFDEGDLELFMSMANQIAFALENHQLNMKMIEEEKRRQNLSRFLSEAIVEKVMKEGTSLKLGGERKRITTMFCDIRGFSMLAERLNPQELLNLLNEHFTAMTEIIFTWQGTLDKYIGDEIMAVFGAPISTGDDAYTAVCAALNMIKRNEEMNVIRKMEGRPTFQIGIGIDTGEVIAGFVGSPRRMEYTVVGDKVNTAKRLCDMAKHGSVVVGHEVWVELKGRVKGAPIGTFRVKNREQSIVAYEIFGLV